MSTFPAPRFQPLYVEHTARTSRGRLRHLFHTQRPGLSSLCRDAQYVIAGDKPPVESLVMCPECRLIGLTELALALDLLGAEEAAIAAAGASRLASFETTAAQSA